ncbi:MAG: 16S rRNA (guanine(527)-N(7))-methyltransferase RsmG [Syntrophales bacterium]|nr:16S rRNA (guanine(527)-N(7))-methyltransferase RsmG [Syntrophales bacterium]
MEQNISRILSEAAGAIGITLGERERILFSSYHRELLAWNKKINLVSVKSPDEIIIKHFVDSLTPVPFIKNRDSKVLDIGTGAGFPGIPLKIAIDSLKVCLLEVSRKKASFLKHIVRTLSLEETTIIQERVEEVMEREIYRHVFDVVISRATFKLSQFLSMGAFFLSRDGILIAMKGPNIKGEELRDAAATSEKLGLTCVGCHDLRLPIIGDLRKIMIYKKF